MREPHRENSLTGMKVDLDCCENDTVSSDEFDLRHACLRLPHPESMASLRRSIARHGVLHPVVAHRDKDVLVLVDGFKRCEIMRDHRDPRVPVRIVPLSEQQAKAALLTLNRPHRGLCEVEEAWVVVSLVREHELSQTEVAQLLERHKSWVCRRLQLVERLESGIVDDIRLGLLSATLARELVRLPRGNQAQVAEVIRRHGMTSRQARELVDRLLESPQKTHDSLLRNPLTYIEKESARPKRDKDPRLSKSGEQLRRALLELEHSAMTTNRWLRTKKLESLRTSDIELLSTVARAIIPLLQDDIEALELVAMRSADEQT